MMMMIDEFDDGDVYGDDKGDDDVEEETDNGDVDDDNDDDLKIVMDWWSWLWQIDIRWWLRK